MKFYLINLREIEGDNKTYYRASILCMNSNNEFVKQVFITKDYFEKLFDFELFSDISNIVEIVFSTDGYKLKFNF